MKKCSKCCESKPLSEFHKSASSRDGLKAKCKTCACIESRQWVANNKEKASETRKKYYLANTAKELAKMKQWRAENQDKCCETKKKWRDANQDKVREYSQKWLTTNPEKRRLAVKKYCESNPEKRKLACSKWSAANPSAKRAHKQNRRARERANGTVSTWLADRLFKLQRGKCACCGESLGTDFHLDHIMPLALGGSNTDDNIQLLRATCNLNKAAKHPVDFMRQRGFLL